MAKSAPNTHYRCSLDFKLSRNYQTIGGSVEFGRDARSDESRDDLIADVEAEVDRCFQEAMNKANKIISGLISGLKKG